MADRNPMQQHDNYGTAGVGGSSGAGSNQVTVFSHPWSSDALSLSPPAELEAANVCLCRVWGVVQEETRVGTTHQVAPSSLLALLFVSGLSMAWWSRRRISKTQRHPQRPKLPGWGTRLPYIRCEDDTGSDQRLSRHRRHHDRSALCG